MTLKRVRFVWNKIVDLLLGPENRFLDKNYKSNLNEREVRDLAIQEALRDGWEWREPTTVARRYNKGKIVWYLMDNSNAMGANYSIEIDDQTGEILKKNISGRCLGKTL